MREFFKRYEEKSSNWFNMNNDMANFISEEKFEFVSILTEIKLELEKIINIRIQTTT